MTSSHTSSLPVANTTPTNSQRDWVLSLGFKTNVSADFKAWIMYNTPQVYNPHRQHTIKHSQLITLKQKHNYESIKGTPHAPWYQFLYKLTHNLLEHSTSTPVQSTKDTDLNIDLLQYNTLLKEHEDLKLKYSKEKRLRKVFNNTITQQKTAIKKLQEQHTLLIQQNNTKITQLEQQLQQSLQKQIQDSRHTQIQLQNAAQRLSDYESELEDAETYIRQCYTTIQQLEKEINIITQENTSYKQDFKDVSSSSLSQQTITELQQKYEQLSLPQYPTIICPITQEIMVEPVIAFDGQSYEKTAIEQWFQSNNKSPSNGTQLPTRILIANHSLRKLIAEIVTST